MKKIIVLIFLAFFQVSVSSLNAQEQSSPNNSVTPQTAPITQESQQQLPKLVSVQIVNVTIGPSKVDGSHWSGSGKVNPTVTTKLAQLLLGSNPYTAVIGLLGSSALTGSGKPAPYGMVEVAVNGQYDPKLAARLFDPRKPLERSYTPIFNLPAYQSVPFNDGTRFKITLYSKNLINPAPTPIGVAVINYNDLLKAYNEEKIYQVSVGDQTENQLLFIGIEVNAVQASQGN